MYKPVNHVQAHCKKCFGSESFEIGSSPSTVCPYCKTDGRVIRDIIFSHTHTYDTGVQVARGETLHTCTTCGQTTTMFSDD